MPIFEYVCPKCGHVFEKLILSRDQPPPVCPYCSASGAEQKFSTFATTGPAVRGSHGGGCGGTGG